MIKGVVIQERSEEAKSDRIENLYMSNCFLIKIQLNHKILFGLIFMFPGSRHYWPRLGS